MATQLPEDVLGLDAINTTIDQEKKLLEEYSLDPRPLSRPSIKMPSARNLMVTLLALCLLTFGLASAVSPWPESREPRQEEKPVGPPLGVNTEDSGFGRLLNAVSRDSLHDLLHRYFPNSYKHGVYPSDHSALEAVHRVDAQLASSIVQMAKRQEDSSNTTTTTNPPPPTTTTTTNPPPPPTTTTTTPPPPATSTATTPPPPSSTPTNPPSSTPTSPNRPPSSSGPTTATSRSSSRSLRPVTSTYTSVIGGSPTVVTATSYVAAEGDAPTSTRPNGSLQTDGAAVLNRDVMLGAVVGAVVGGALLM